jgi:DNA-nicking Smr family endonuclease
MIHVLAANIHFYRSLSMAKYKLDLHDIYNKGTLIDQALNEAIDECVESKIGTLEIIPGKGSGQLKKKVIRFLEQKHIKNKYHRIDKDSKNFGRLFVYFRFK